MIDNWGRGTLNIIDYMSKDNLDFPKFEESACYFHIDFKRQFDPNEMDNVATNVVFVTINVPTNEKCLQNLMSPKMSVEMKDWRLF